MGHCYAEFLVIVGLFLLNVYVLLSYWKWSLGLVLLYLGYRLTRVKRRLTIAGKAVLITGCDTGFGHHTAKRLDEMGFTVYAGVLNENSDGAENLRSRKSDNLHVIKLDVTKEEDVNKSLEYVTSNNKADLWAVVNNAGINMPGDVELATVEQYKKCAEVNLYGPIRVIRAFLPLIRRAKGRIVNVSSVRGVYGWPSESMYHVTKHGLETLSDSLRMEMKKFGVKVVVVEPGDFADATAINGREMMNRIQREMDYMWKHASDEVKKTYGRHYLNRNLKNSFENDGTLSMSPFTDAIVDALISENPNISYWSCLLAILLIFSILRFISKNSHNKLDIGRKGVFITGCDTGFGHHLAKRLDDKGYTVYAGVLSEQSPGAKALHERKSDSLHVIQLDVTKDDNVKQALAFVRSTGQGLWAIVNNAGINFPADVELATVDQYKRCAEVNLYGMLRVIKAFLPMIRKSKGRIVNMSSVKGRYPWPGDSVYVVTKHGIETMSDSLRLEMKKFGVKVAVIEPGQYDGATSISSPEQLKRLRKEIDNMWEHASQEVRQTYGRSYFDAIYQGMEKGTSGGRSMSADPVLNAIEDSLINVTPQARYLVGGSFSVVDKLGILAKVYNFLPEFISDWIIAKMTGCGSFTH